MENLKSLSSSNRSLTQIMKITDADSSPLPWSCICKKNSYKTKSSLERPWILQHHNLTCVNFATEEQICVRKSFILHLIWLVMKESFHRSTLLSTCLTKNLLKDNTIPPLDHTAMLLSLVCVVVFCSKCILSTVLSIYRNMETNQSSNTCLLTFSQILHPDSVLDITQIQLIMPVGQIIPIYRRTTDA